MSPAAPTDIRETARTKLLGAAMSLIREKGYAATTVDELCATAGVTKGAFFHHFPSKEALGVAAADHWSSTTRRLFDAADFHRAPTPIERVFAYLDLRLALIEGPLEAFTCVAGTLVQETFLSSPPIRAACERSIVDNAGMLEADLAEVIAERGLQGVTAHGLSLHIQAVIQGGFILAKATGSAAVARESVDHLRRYFGLLFGEAASSLASPGPKTASDPARDSRQDQPTGRPT